MNFLFEMFLFFLLTIPILFASKENTLDDQMAYALVYPHGSLNLTESDDVFMGKIIACLKCMTQQFFGSQDLVAYGFVYPQGGPQNLIQRDDQVVPCSSEVDEKSTALTSLVDDVSSISLNDFESKENEINNGGIKRSEIMNNDPEIYSENIFAEEKIENESKDNQKNVDEKKKQIMILKNQSLILTKTRYLYFFIVFCYIIKFPLFDDPLTNSLPILMSLFTMFYLPKIIETIKNN